MRAPYYSGTLPAGGAPVRGPTGIAFGGGGSRAVACCLGALRGLTALGLVPSVDYLAAVSGGAWVAGPYAYLPDAVSDADFLGPAETPASLEWGPDEGIGVPGDLTYVTRHGLAGLPDHISTKRMIEMSQEMLKAGKVPPSRIWGRVCESLFLAPFGLGSADPEGGGTRYMGYTREWFEQHVAGLPGNESLTPDDFDFYPSGRARPFVLINAALFLAGQKLSDMVPFEATPVGTGVPPIFRAGGQNPRDVGGGWLETFAYGADAYEPVAARSQVGVDGLSYRFGVGDAVGASCAYFQGGGNENPFQPIVPTYPYTSILDFQKESGRTHPYQLTDGGSMEVTGIVSLLRHGVTRLAAFINCQTPLSEDAKTGQIVTDAQIPPLFGVQPAVSGEPYRSYRDPLLKPEFAAYANNQVFPEADFEPLVTALWASAGAGEGGVFAQDTVTVENPWQGVEGGKKVRVVWVYNQAAPTWHAELSSDLQARIAADPELRTFPNFGTEDATLEPRRVNLLANLSCWKVMSGALGGSDGPDHAALFRSLLARG